MIFKKIEILSVKFEEKKHNKDIKKYLETNYKDNYFYNDQKFLIYFDEKNNYFGKIINIQDQEPRKSHQGTKFILKEDIEKPTSINGYERELPEILRKCFITDKSFKNTLGSTGVKYKKEMILFSGPDEEAKKQMLTSLSDAYELKCQFLNVSAYLQDNMGYSLLQSINFSPKWCRLDFLKTNDRGIFVISDVEKIPRELFDYLMKKFEMNENGMFLFLAPSIENIPEDFQKRIYFTIDFQLPSEKDKRDLIVNLIPDIEKSDSLLENEFLKQIGNMSRSKFQEILIKSLQREPTDLKNELLKSLNETNSKYGRNIYSEYNNRFISYGASIEKIILKSNQIIKTLFDSKRFNSNIILIHGESGTGTTNLALHIAYNNDFDFIQMISSSQLYKLDTIGKFEEIKQSFENSKYGKHSCIILDDIEQLFEYDSTKIDENYSRDLLIDILEILQMKPKNGKKLLVIITSKFTNLLKNLALKDVFDYKFKLENLNSQEIEYLLKQTKIFENCQNINDYLCILRSSKSIKELRLILQFFESQDIHSPESFKHCLENVYIEI